MSDPNELPIHPLCACISEMGAEEFAELCEDIREQGLVNKITLYQGQVLDGRNRYRACLKVGVKLTADDFFHFEGTWEQAKARVKSENLAGRVWTPGQRAMSAAKLHACRPDGESVTEAFRVNGTAAATADADGEAAPAKGPTQAEAAKDAGASRRNFQRAVVVDREAPELAQKVLAGEVSLREAERQVAEKKPRRKKGNKKQQTRKADALHDATGAAVPDQLRDVFGDPWLENLVATADGWHAQMQSKAIADAISGKAAAYGYLRAADALKHLAAAIDSVEQFAAALRAGQFHAVHPACEGQGCKECLNLGAVPEWRMTELVAEGGWE